jgi:hypothetical protein
VVAPTSYVTAAPTTYVNTQPTYVNTQPTYVNTQPHYLPGNSTYVTPGSYLPGSVVHGGSGVRLAGYPTGGSGVRPGSRILNQPPVGTYAY